ncbi:MAG: cbb3-type cytochrome oxidase assembly protein CcoS [Bdellovibrionaceae bacterium]|nr:cbb3-type cytochrome oxidase assembly protein CcoS [Pseudobdellovibrionaceae bacterium]
MNVILLMIPVSLLLAGTFLFLFLRTLSSGQLDDLETPAHRILMDHERKDQK